MLSLMPSKPLHPKTPPLGSATADTGFSNRSFALVKRADAQATCLALRIENEDALHLLTPWYKLPGRPV